MTACWDCHPYANLTCWLSTGQSSSSSSSSSSHRVTFFFLQWYTWIIADNYPLNHDIWNVPLERERESSKVSKTVSILFLSKQLIVHTMGKYVHNRKVATNTTFTIYKSKSSFKCMYYRLNHVEMTCFIFPSNLNKLYFVHAGHYRFIVK